MKISFYLVFVATAIAVSGSDAIAQAAGGYDLHWNAPAAGGGASCAMSGYMLNGTIAQSHAGPAGALNGANGYVMRGGFWPGVHSSDVIFRSGFESQCGG